MRFNFYVALNVAALWAFTKGQAGTSRGKIDKRTHESDRANMNRGSRCLQKPHYKNQK